jgi:hypothetical protein
LAERVLDDQVCVSCVRSNWVQDSTIPLLSQMLQTIKHCFIGSPLYIADLHTAVALTVAQRESMMRSTKSSEGCWKKREESWI